MTDADRVSRKREREDDGKDEEGVKASVPEPPPKAGKVSVTQDLLALLAKPTQDPKLDIRLPHLMKLVTARSLYGFNKYRQELMTHDGRDPNEDAIQELGDFLQYAYKAIIMGIDITDLMEMYAAVGLVLERSLKARDAGRVSSRHPTEDEIDAHYTEIEARLREESPEKFTQAR